MPMNSACGDEASPSPGFPIRVPADQNLLTTPRSFSQSTAPFFGLWHQGIRRTPLVT